MALKIRYHKNGAGLTAWCSFCKKTIWYATDCNAGGLVYAKVAAEENYQKHRCKRKVKNGGD